MDEKTVLVTGAGGGIGEGIAQVLAARGWHVLVNDVDHAAFRAAAKPVLDQFLTDTTLGESYANFRTLSEVL